MSMIHTEALVRRFRGGVIAVDGLDLDVEEGELFGIVGPDGAGKTTTLRLLAAIMKPTGGIATVAGYDTVREAEAVKREIGYMPQQFGLYPDLSVEENLNFVCDIFGLEGEERRRRIDELLGFAGLSEFRKRRGGHLSGGMQKKLVLASALIHKPRVLLLDEPTTGVDPVARRQFWEMLSELHSGGTTIVVCTPYMDEAERCNRVGLMYEGRMIVCDTPAALKRMLPGVVLAVSVPPRAMIDAEQALRRLPGVLDVQAYGDRIHLIASGPEIRPELEAVLAAEGIKLLDLRPVPPRMEEAFIYMIRSRGS